MGEPAELSLDRHVRAHQLALASEIGGRAKIYLDLRFWIIVREVLAGTRSEGEERKFVDLLCDGVASGRLICPISESVFMELMKQSNTPTRRAATASVIDNLSLGVCLIPLDWRIRTEISHFLNYTGGGSVDLYDLEILVWTKLSYALGYMHPNSPKLSPEQNLMLQKMLFEKMWGISLSEMISTIGDAEMPSSPFGNLAQHLNTGNAIHSSELRSFAQTLVVELEGAVDACAKDAAKILAHMGETKIGVAVASGEAGWAETVSMCKALLNEALGHAAGRKALRSLFIEACLHASLRWNKGQKFKANDFYDFAHAAAGVGYCDAFFTEGPLAAAITAKSLNLCELFPCRVTADVSEAISVLESLLASAGKSELAGLPPRE